MKTFSEMRIRLDSLNQEPSSVTGEATKDSAFKARKKISQSHKEKLQAVFKHAHPASTQRQS